MALIDGRRCRVAVGPDDRQATTSLDPLELEALVLPVLDVPAAHAAVSWADVVHLHLGLPGPAVDEVRRVADVLLSSQVPFLLTVHDLDDRVARSLDHLVPVAALLVAPHVFLASELLARWGRPAVVADPSLPLPPDLVAAWRRPVDPDGATWVGLVGGRGSSAERAVSEVAALDHTIRVDRHDGRVTDPRDIGPWLAGLDLVVLPADARSRGTWLGLCEQLGVGVVAPVSPVEVEPRALATYLRTAGPGAIARAVLHASTGLPVARRPLSDEVRRLGRVRDGHTTTYRVLARAGRTTQEPAAWTRR